mmetsp:Transcript_31360/g.91518  ORF Transcript_31360/g.91518 Transcript_31360/m.91518 type:complete len:475 (+) Transcript_31360:838-2262(+)
MDSPTKLRRRCPAGWAACLSTGLDCTSFWIATLSRRSHRRESFVTTPLCHLSHAFAYRWSRTMRCKKRRQRKKKRPATCQRCKHLMTRLAYVRCTLMRDLVQRMASNMQIAGLNFAVSSMVLRCFASWMMVVGAWRSFMRPVAISCACSSSDIFLKRRCVCTSLAKEAMQRNVSQSLWPKAFCWSQSWDRFRRRRIMALAACSRLRTRASARCASRRWPLASRLLAARSLRKRRCCFLKEICSMRLCSEWLINFCGVAFSFRNRWSRCRRSKPFSIGLAASGGRSGSIFLDIRYISSRSMRLANSSEPRARGCRPALGDIGFGLRGDPGSLLVGDIRFPENSAWKVQQSWSLWATLSVTSWKACSSSGWTWLPKANGEHVDLRELPPRLARSFLSESCSAAASVDSAARPLCARMLKASADEETPLSMFGVLARKPRSGCDKLVCTRARAPGTVELLLLPPPRPAQAPPPTPPA